MKSMLAVAVAAGALWAATLTPAAAEFCAPAIGVGLRRGGSGTPQGAACNGESEN